MGIFSRNKKKKEDSLLEDDWGEKDVPYDTGDRKLEAKGIKEMRGRSQKSKAIEKKLISFFIIVSVSFVTITFINSIISTSRISGMDKKLEQAQSPAFKSRYEALGESVIRSYFAGENPPVNLLDSARWNGEDSQGNAPAGAKVLVENIALIDVSPSSVLPPIPSDEKSKDKAEHFNNPRREVLTYRGTIDGRSYRFAVNFVIPDIDDASKLPFLVSPPTILDSVPLVRSDIDASKPESSGPDALFEEVTLSNESTDTVAEWASAFAQDNGAVLKRIVGDGDATHIYRGIGGFSLVGTPTVEWSYEFESPDTGTNMIVARVSFNMEAPVSGASSVEDSVSSGGNSDAFQPLQVMDILLSNYEQGTPNIVAWDGAGEWDTLEPKMNAIVLPEEGKEPKEITETTPTDEPSQDSDSDSETSTSENSVPGAPSLTPSKTPSESSSTSSKKTSKKSNNPSKKSHRKTTSRNSSHD